MDKKRISVYATALTDPGGRRINEDAVYTCQAVEADKSAGRGRLYIVADGTGAQEGGQTASSMAVAIIGEHFYDDTSPDIGESLCAAITTAHTALYELAQKVTTWAEMSTTIVAAVLHEGKLYVAHVGDSRAYLVRDGQARLLTRDHVWLKDDENYGALTHWLGGGGRPSVQVDLTIETLQENDDIVLCSDGLTDVVDGIDMGALVSKSPPQSTARQLVELANRRGTGDNISAAVIRYGGKTPAPPWRRWAWIGGGMAALLALVITTVLILPGGPKDEGDGNSGGDSGGGGVVDQPTATSTLPAHIQVEETATPTPTEVMSSVEETRQPTSTPVPATDTPTPRPTRVVVPTTEPTVAPITPVEVTAPPSHPTSKPKPKPTEPPSRD